MSYIHNIRDIRKSHDLNFGVYVGFQKNYKKSIATNNGSNLDSPSILKLPIYHCMYIKQLMQL